MAKAVVTKTGALSMQVCVPPDWDDEQVIAFAEGKNPCGTTNGWFIRKHGQPERGLCSKNNGNVHIMLDA